LTEKLSNGFDTRAAKKLGEYSPIVNALGEWDKANEVSTIRQPAGAIE
jgi:peptide chain release factor 1